MSKGSILVVDDEAIVSAPTGQILIEPGGERDFAGSPV